MNKETAQECGAEVRSLAGQWRMRMDEESDGARRGWFREHFTDATVTLPGTMDTHARQAPVTSGDLKGFAPVHPYRGAVWFQREIEIPEAWRGRRLNLLLERCQWETCMWVDDTCQGLRNSLVAPHVYDLTGALTPGRHRLTIMVDNSNRRNGMTVGADNLVKYYDLTTEIKAGAKLNCGGHHLWAHNWNGILGRMELRATDTVSLSSVDVYPEVGAGQVRIRMTLANVAGAKETVHLSATCRLKEAGREPVATHTWSVQLSGAPEQAVEQRLKLTGPVQGWDEFSPILYECAVQVTTARGAEARQVTFGMRELRTAGARMLLNGRALSLRGTLEDFIFPLTGYPPMDVESWRKVMSIAKSYGLNFFRFHSCCPPAAAFEAADELGFYLQVELPGTSCPMQDESLDVEEFLFAELKHILSSFGNHPSFLTLSMGNEQLFAGNLPEFLARHKAVLARKVRYAQEHDPRHLYTSTSHPWTADRVDDFFVSAWPRTGSEPLCGIMWSGGKVIDCSRFNTRPPETVFDYGAGLAGLDRPLLTHEVGQWAVYPDLREITRYHGAQRACNFEIIRERLREKGMLEWANDFTRASGMLALLLYKEEIESVLRTPGLSGFMLLDVHDFPGQGTSTVGILNALWESKGLTTPARFRAFCGPTVLLARLPKRVWTTGEIFEARVDLANYGAGNVTGCAVWSLSGEDGRVYAEGTLPRHTVSQGSVGTVGGIRTELNAMRSATRLTLRVELAGVNVNTWDVWVYPEEPAAAPAAGVILATRWDEEVREALRRGGRVLLVPAADELRRPIPGTFTPVFWNVQMKHEQVSKTMGILCDPANPALAAFPTDFHSNWQWWDPVMQSCALCVDGFPAALRPIVQVVDSFTENRRLALVFEAKVGAGRLIVCSVDICRDLASRPVARQLRKSLLDYMAGAMFLPDVAVAEEVLGTVLVKR